MVFGFLGRSQSETNKQMQSIRNCDNWRIIFFKFIIFKPLVSQIKQVFGLHISFEHISTTIDLCFLLNKERIHFWTKLALKVRTKSHKPMVFSGRNTSTNRYQKRFLEHISFQFSALLLQKIESRKLQLGNFDSFI